MADSVGAWSNEVTSDEIIDPYCNPCFKGGTILRAAGYCPECIEFYCQNCLDIHRRMSITQHHEIQRGSVMPAREATKPLKYFLCEKHHRQNKDKYCFDHCVLICEICTIKGHKECDIKPVPEACKEFDISADEEALIYDAGCLYDFAKTANQSLTDNINGLDTQKQELIRSSEVFCNKIKERINTSFDEFCSDVTDIVCYQKNVLSESQLEVKRISDDVADVRKSLELSNKRSLSVPQQFINLQTNAERVQAYKDELHLRTLTKSTLVCNFNQDMKSIAESGLILGKVSFKSSFGYATPDIHYPCRQQSREEKQSWQASRRTLREEEALPCQLIKSGKIFAKKDNKPERYQIFGLDVTTDGLIIVTAATVRFRVTYQNCIVKLFSAEGQLLSFMTLKDKPGDVTVLSKSDAAMILAETQIAIIDLKNTAELYLKSTMKLSYNIRGLVSHNNSFIIACGPSSEDSRSVKKINMNGKIIWEITADEKGIDLFSQATFLAVHCGSGLESVFISDWEKHTITVVDALTGQLLKTCGAGGYNPKGLAVDEYGHLYVCYGSGEISSWSKDIKERTCLFPAEEDFRFPYAIVYNCRTKEFLVTYSNDNIRCRNFIYRYRITYR